MKRNLLTNLDKPRPADAKVGANRLGWMRLVMGVVLVVMGIDLMGQVNITPIRTDVAGFASWTDTDVAGTTYVQLLKATSVTITPAMDFNSYTTETLEFNARTYGGDNATENIITVSISTDNGSTWTVLGTRTPPTNTLTAMTSFDLSSYNGTQVLVKFSVAGTSNTIGAGIDDISITGNISCTPLPSDPTGTITPATNPACGSTTLSYDNATADIYWQTSASGTSTINPTTSNLIVTSSGTYYVRAYNGTCWSTNSLASATITINTAPAITTQPTNQSVSEPSTATFSIVASNATGYQWQLSTDNGSTWSNISGATSASYTTGATSLVMSGYQYRCIASASPCSPATSNAATLTVNSGPCLSESAFAACPAGWAETDITYLSGEANFASYTGELVTIAVSNPTLLTFDLRRTDNTTAKTLYVEVSTTTQGGTYTAVATYTLGNTTSDGITACTVDLSAYTGFSLVFIKFRKASSTISPWYLDNMAVYCNSSLPILTLSPSSITGFTYAYGSGPSASQSYSLAGSNLTGFPGNITVTAPSDYEVSLDNSTFAASLNVAYTTATLGATTIYVRLKAGLASGTYNGHVIENAGGGVSAPVEVICSGNVTGPTITVSSTFLNGFNYLVSAGPSSSQTYTVSGSLLSPAAGNITLTAPTDFEISTDGTNYFASLSLPYTLSTLDSTTIYVRLKAGLAVGSYNNEVLSHLGGTAATVNTTLSGFVSDPSVLPTVLEKGDFAILAVNNYADGVVGNSADEISFVCFKDLNPGTTIYFTDNGYERKFAGLWGNTEGVVSMTRINSTLPKGTIISIHSVNGGINEVADFTVYTCGAADANWTKDVVSSASYFFDLNKDDQVWFMQGGTWANLGTALHDATYIGGNVLYGWTDIDWKTAPDYASTKGSTIYPGCNCFVTDVNNPVSGASQVKFDDPAAVDFSSATNARLDWIAMINEPANWDYYTSDADYDAGGYNYLGSATCPAMTIAVNTYVDGKWTGNKNTNWFECENWNTFVIPNETTNVLIPSGTIPNEPTIGDPPTFPVVYTGAECNDIDIQIGRILTMNHTNSVLDVYNNWSQEGTLSFTNGIVNFIDGNSTISGSGAKVFYNLKLNKTASSNTLTLSGNDISVSNVLTLTKGILTTGTSRVIITNTAPTAITGHVIPGSSAYTGYINGNLRRNVAATGSYDFPVGTAAQYEYSNINLTASSGLTYIDAFFTAPHTTSIDITSLGLMVGTSTLNELLNYGFWTITPDAGTYTYDVTLTERLHTNAGSTADAHTVVKRPDAVSNWVLQGTHLNSTQSMGTSPVNWVTAKRTGLTIFSDFAIAKSNTGTLPVELVKFDVYLSNGIGILEWSTASETNCSHYLIERSVNDMLHFEPIGTVAGSGNSNIPNCYALKDMEVQPGINYYRLVQYDFDGTRNELGVRYIVLTAENEPISIANISNSGNAISADIINIQSGNFEVQVLDATGKLVYSAISESGDDAYRVIVNNLPSKGIYMLRVSDGFSSDVKKFVVF